MSYSNIKRFNKATLRSSPNLRALYLTGNELGQNYSLWKTLLHSVPMLEFLSVSDNKIKQLPKTTFSKMKAIKDIDLSKNSHSEFNMELKGVPELETLDLSYNLLPSLQEAFLQQLEHRSSNNKTTTINLFGNPFQCNCKAIEFLQFIKTVSQHNIVFKHLDEYSCLQNNITVPTNRSGHCRFTNSMSRK